MLFRFRYTKQGGHTHVQLFAGRHDAALGRCGNFVMRNEEWELFKHDITRADAEGGLSSDTVYDFVEEPIV